MNGKTLNEVFTFNNNLLCGIIALVAVIMVLYIGLVQSVRGFTSTMASYQKTLVSYQKRIEELERRGDDNLKEELSKLGKIIEDNTQYNERRFLHIETALEHVKDNKEPKFPPREKDNG